MEAETHRDELAGKIAALIEERGWNLEDFARRTGLNRQTIRQILKRNVARRLRNGTISRCARAFGLSVSELRALPMEQLLRRLADGASRTEDESCRRLYDEATQPELLAWMERNPERAAHLSAAEIDELLSLQGTGGPLTSIGVEHFVEVIERKRRLIQQVNVIAGTEYLDMLEQLISLLYDKVQPYKHNSSEVSKGTAVAENRSNDRPPPNRSQQSKQRF
jgi:transcriptional regulator with XRE-family HTH domain